MKKAKRKAKKAKKALKRAALDICAFCWERDAIHETYDVVHERFS